VTINEIDTPALVVDLDEMEGNLERMAAFFAEKPAKLRPHFKNHKSPFLARKQLAAGAIGLTCATVREAEVLVSNGIRRILIANEIAGSNQISRFAELSSEADVIVSVDDERVIAEIAAASRARSVTLASSSTSTLA
jgi:D-serine deaminase-like pyridoxal phosphate-dependent protein